MPGIRARRKPHAGSVYPSQVVGWRARYVRKRSDLSQGNVAAQMVALGHETWTRQTVAAVEAAERNLTVDELVSLAAVLRTTLVDILTPTPLVDPARAKAPYSHQPIDIGKPHPLTPFELGNLYGWLGPISSKGRRVTT